MEHISIYQITMGVHYLVSIFFLISAIWLLIRSTRGVSLELEYTKLDRWLAYFFIINLYLQLLFGIILFANIGLPLGAGYQSPDGSVAVVSKRLWPIEHIVLMLFALFIANLGLIFSGKSSLAKEKHRKILVYYAVSISLIAISLASVYVL